MRMRTQWNGTALGLERINKRLLRAMRPCTNPVQRAQVYADALAAGKKSYRDVAQQFEVSREEVCHYVTILRRLPKKIVAAVGRERDPRRLRKLSLRSLLAIARLRTAAEKHRAWKTLRRAVAGDRSLRAHGRPAKAHAEMHRAYGIPA